MNDIKFIINTDNNTVVAILPNMEDVTDEVARKCTKSTTYAVLELIENAYRFKQPELDIPYEAKFKGVAYCDRHDMFCKNIGKDISENKALKKYHSSMAKKYARLSELLKKASEEMCSLEASHIVKALNAEKSINKYTSVNDNDEELLNNLQDGYMDF